MISKAYEPVLLLFIGLSILATILFAANQIEKDTSPFSTVNDSVEQVDDATRDYIDRTKNE